MPREARLLAFIGLVLATAAPSRTHSAPAALSERQQAVLVRVDSLWEANSGPVSRDLITRHIAEARAGADSLFLLNLLCRDGRLLAALNRAVEAEPVLREGMLLANTLKEPLLYRTCLRWLGVALIARGRLQDVMTSFEQLLRLSRESGDRYHEGYAWMGLAYHDWQSDSPEDAREKYTRSVNIFRELGQVRGELWALVGLNNALTMLGEYEKALAGHRRIAAIGRSSGSREIEALGHNNLGVLLFSLGDLGEALANFQRAAQLQVQNGNVRESIIAGMNVCICEITLGRTQQASRRLRDLLETSRANGYTDVQVSLLKELGYAHLQQGDCRLAARLFREALSMPEGLTPKPECETLIGLSEALTRMDSTGSALQLLRSKATTMLRLEDPRIQFAFRNEMAGRLLDEGLPSEALEMAMAVERRGAGLGLTRLRLEAIPLAARASLALGQPDSASVLLRRGLRLWEADRGLPLDPEWREQRGAAAKELFTQLTWLTLHRPSERPREERIREAFDALQIYKARTLLERIMGPGGKKVPVLQASPVTLDRLQTQVLQPGELLLDFLTGPEYSLLFACTPRECRAQVLPGEIELNDKIHLFHELLATRPPGPGSRDDIESIEAAARSLAEPLFSSCADLIAGSRHIIVVPDGALNLIPFSFLFRTDATVTSEHGAAGPSPSFPGFGRTESQVPAATVLAWLRRGVGRPDKAHDLPARILALASRYTDQGEILRGAKKEISFLARRYAGVTTRLQDADVVREGTGLPPLDSAMTAGSSARDTLPESPAVERRLSDRTLADFDILHFAAHSTVDDQSPWRSAIHLGDKPFRASGVVLRASEIAGWKLPARLVVLSSCESAGGRVLSGEGMLGLTSAFLSAGVPSILATLWPVDDEVTVDFMTAFYKALEEGESVSSSLRRAQDALRRRNQSAHPFYWAGFVLTGDGEIRVNLRERSHAARLWWTFTSLPIIIWLVVRGRKKKCNGPQ